MDYWHSLTSNIRYFYNNMNSATLSGAIDVIVVEQPDGSLLSTPFHVRFGKYGVFNSNEKYVDIMINNEEIKGLKMKLAENGVAYFVQETDESEVPEYLASSPPPSSPVAVDSAIEENIRKLKKQQRKESRIDYEKKRNAAGGGSISRSPSPSSRISKSTMLTEVDIILETPPSTPQISTLDQKAKMKLPFSSSIFSNRRYRSLPDLSNISASLEHGQQSNQTFHKGHSRKMTVGYISPKEADSIKVLPIPVSPSRSRSSPKFIPPKSPIGEFLIPESKSSSEIDGVRTEPATPMKSVNFVPTDDSDSDGSTVKPKESTTSTIARKPSSAALDMIADGALSDSEVDRTRMTAGTPSDTVWKWGEFPESSKQQKKKETQPAKSSDSYWSWFSWGRSTQPPEEEKGIYLGDLVGKEHDPKDYEKYFGKHSASSTVSSVADSGTGHSVQSPASPSTLSVESLNSDGTEIPTPTPREIKRALEENEAIDQEMIAGTDENSKKPKTKIGVEVKEKARQKSGNSVTSTSEQSGLSDDETMQIPMKRTKHIRSLRLSNEELKALQLQYGSNEARFSITTKFQGTSWCACHIYLFKYSEKIVISDIDGTITKSDVLGHVIAAIGGQWAHVGVAELYTRIKENGYKMVYLSSRAIGQSHYTKTYLQSLAQGSRTLPDGPVLLSPTSVLMAFRKEVIERKPEEFKIACLSDLKALFPVKQPFYAGFGNRDTDVKSYVSVDIPPERILIINPSGAVRRADHIGFVSSYATMAMETVDYLFPPIHSTVRKSSYDGEFSGVPEKMSTNFTKPETCSTFTFWQTAPEQVVKVDDELEAYERKRKEMADKNKKVAKKKK